MSRLHRLAFAATVAGLVLTACSTTPKSAEGRADLRQDADAALATAQKRDPTFADAMRTSVGYAVLPKIGKAAAGVGGAYGKGVLYEKGKMVGYCDMSQATVGLQLGGQTYTEIICFKDKEALDKFKRGDFAFDAQTSAVAMEAGAGANAKYAEGLQVFTMNEAGMMFEVAVGGQKFSYEPS